MEEGGLALIAAELRRDALIAPSGCGQYRGDEEEEGVQGQRNRVSSLPDVVIRPSGCLVYMENIYIWRQMCRLNRRHSWEFNPSASSWRHAATAAASDLSSLCVYI